MRASVPPLLSAEEVESVLGPIERARTLPDRAYFAETFYERERQRIFSEQWVGLTTDAIVAAPGDCEPVWLAGTPLLVLRQPSGRVAVFHNLCVYDGCPVLLEGVKGVDTLEAAYHGWRYDLEGKLVGTPYWSGLATDDRASVDHPELNLDLVEVPSEVFAHVLFVNVSGRAALSFDEFIAPMRERLRRFDVARFEVGCDPASGKLSCYTETLACNWKTFLENDDPNIYHEGFVHAGYRRSNAVPRCDAEGRPMFDPVASEREYGFTFDPSATPGTYPEFPEEVFLKGVDGKPVTDLRGFVALYPNVCYAMSGPQFRVALVLPLGPGETQVTEFFCYDADVAASAEHRHVVEKLDARLMHALAEDRRPCEAVHAARRSPAKAGSRFFSPYWDAPLHALARRLVSDLMG